MVRKVLFKGEEMTLRRAAQPLRTIWHGQQTELTQLRWCVANYCTCRPGKASADRCSVHELLADQRTLDHIAFVRWNRDHFVRGEWLLGGDPAWDLPPRASLLARMRSRISTRKAKQLICAVAIFALGGLAGIAGPSVASMATSTPSRPPLSVSNMGVR
jgi:hypothetical protein